MHDLVIQSVDVLRCEDHRCEVLRDRDIVIRGNRIADVRPAVEVGPDEARDRIQGDGLLDQQAPQLWPPHDAAAKLVYSARAGDVRTVICDGRAVMRDRELLTLDETEILARVAESMQRLARRVPDARIQLYRP